MITPFAAILGRLILVHTNKVYIAFLNRSREVEAANPAAVNLYREAAFEQRENPNKLSKNLYMVKEL
jgi:hypothetical protein